MEVQEKWRIWWRGRGKRRGASRVGARALGLPGWTPQRSNDSLRKLLSFAKSLSDFAKQHG